MSSPLGAKDVRERHDVELVGGSHKRIGCQLRGVKAARPAAGGLVEAGGILAVDCCAIERTETISMPRPPRYNPNNPEEIHIRRCQCFIFVLLAISDYDR